MKKSIFLSASFVLVSLMSTAQNNTFPTSGNVGIGTTTPDQALVVKGSISFDYGDTKSYNGFRRVGAKTEYYNLTTGGTSVIHEFTGSNGAIISLANDGKVGIGTTAPSAELEVKSVANNNAEIHINSSTDGNSSVIRFQDAGQDAWGIISNYPAAGKFSLYNYNNNSNAMVVNANGNIGIGTTNPASKLHVNSTEKNAFRVYKEGISDKYLNVWHGSSGAVIEPIKENGGTSELYIGGYDNPTNLYLSTNGGNVGIGVTDTKGYKLGVKGKIAAEEVKVALYNSWPDYVFENNYNLPSLQEVEHHIVEEGHLPNIPSASEVEKNGIQLGEMNAKLLQKIEELTLYMIAQNKKTEQLQKEIELLKQKNIKLEKKIK